MAIATPLQMKDPKYFDVREVRCWITGGKPKHKERQTDTRQRKRHNTWNTHA